MTQTVSTAVATQAKPTAGAMVKQYSADFASVLPSHIKPAQWVRLAQGALKKGKRDASGLFELEQAALNNPGVFLATLLDAARLGLEPGTEQYYLTPRKVKGRLEILGITGYQGLIELIYRAGAVSSVIAECVFANDHFSYRPGRDERPDHGIDWDSEDRGALRLVYAYAVMKDGATSKVVVLNRAQINTIKKSSQGANTEYSPWVTNEPAMWLKSAVRQLAKWVPTSSEYRRQQMRDAQQVADERDATTIQPLAPGPGEYVDPVTGEVLSSAPEDEVETVEGELVDDQPQQPDPNAWDDVEVAQPGGAR